MTEVKMLNIQMPLVTSGVYLGVRINYISETAAETLLPCMIFAYIFGFILKYTEYEMCYINKLDLTHMTN